MNETPDNDRILNEATDIARDAADDSILFTPRLLTTNDRLRMRLSVEDSMRFAAHRYDDGAIVTDLLSGLRYLAVGADCSAACRCDAIVSPI
jgi:hypothetical protein